MTLHLHRRPSHHDATIGALAIDGVFHCWTCEDVIREQPGVPVEQWKVQGATAIPQGTYRIALTLSQRFQRVLPLLLHVPGFTGVRIHPGNGAADSSGCILPGYDRRADRVGRSKEAFEALFAKMLLEPNDLAITIENPVA